jgi:hypothetical protein
MSARRDAGARVEKRYAALSTTDHAERRVSRTGRTLDITSFRAREKTRTPQDGGSYTHD